MHTILLRIRVYEVKLILKTATILIIVCARCFTHCLVFKPIKLIIINYYRKMTSAASLYEDLDSNSVYFDKHSGNISFE